LAKGHLTEFGLETHTQLNEECFGGANTFANTSNKPNCSNIERGGIVANVERVYCRFAD